MFFTIRTMDALLSIPRSDIRTAVLVRLLFLVCLALPAFADDPTVPAGVLVHGEHLADLVLGQGGVISRRHSEVLHKLLGGLISQAEKGVVASVNEKIDGSPAVVFGFDREGAPFVAYKGELKKRNQGLIRTPAEARRHFAGKPALGAIYASLISRVGGQMGPLSEKYRDVVFQGDLLFTEFGGRVEKTPECVTLKPNTVTYRVCQGHPYFEPLKRAKVAVVLHTIGKRVFNKAGNLQVAYAPDRGRTQAFAESLNSAGVFAITPWRKNVALDRGLDSATAQSLRDRLGKAVTSLQKLPRRFRAAWAKTHEKSFRVFFNSALYGQGDGGIYAHAAQDMGFNFDLWTQRYRAWLAERGAQNAIESFQLDFETFQESFRTLLTSYYEVLAVQAQLLPPLSQAFKSILGGGESEGLVLSEKNAVVKLVDRLGFTRRNFQRSLADFDRLPEPFNVWRPGAIFVVMKGQPVHAGHIAMVKQVVKENPGRDVFVIASEKEPNLRATDYKEIAKSRRAAREGEFTHVFDARIRRRILELGLGQSVPFYILNVGTVTAYASLAKSLGLEGTIYRAMGSKEEGTSRFADEFRKYGSHIAPLYVEMQAGGISGTQTREAIAQMSTFEKEKPADAQTSLDRAFAFIDEPQRSQVCGELVRQFRAMRRLVRRLIKDSD